MRRTNNYVQIKPTVIEQARQMDLLSYWQRYEPINLKRVAGNVYCTKEHDSLKISNGKWYQWSRGFGGISALYYLIKIKEYSFVEAVEALDMHRNGLEAVTCFHAKRRAKGAAFATKESGL